MLRTVMLGLSLSCLAVLANGQEEEKPAVNDATAGFSFEGFSRAFGEAFGIILATEIGDRTFFIAAIMAMRHSRLVIWFGAVGALVVMTVLSTLVGHVAPLLISRTYTQYAAAALFLFFGIKMLREGLSIDHSGASEELEEVELELTKKEEDTPADEESGAMIPKDEAPNKVLMQAFTLTFLAEWGDRSQIATIALVRTRTNAAAALRPALSPLTLADRSACSSCAAALAGCCAGALWRDAGRVHRARAVHWHRRRGRQAPRELHQGTHRPHRRRRALLPLLAPGARRRHRLSTSRLRAPGLGRTRTRYKRLGVAVHINVCRGIHRPTRSRLVFVSPVCAVWASPSGARPERRVGVWSSFGACTSGVAGP